MKTYDFTVVIWKEEGGYVSRCSELGVASCGSTISEASDNLKEAIELYLENATALGVLDDIEASLTSREKYTSHLEIVQNA